MGVSVGVGGAGGRGRGRGGEEGSTYVRVVPR